MMRKQILWANLVIALCLGAPSAQSADEGLMLRGEALRQLVSGHTVTGRHDTGMPYSEWHAPTGQVYGHNNREPNENACWDIKGNAVCYYYAGGASRGTYCWTFKRVAEGGYRLRSIENGVEASGIWQAGNLYDFSDNGKSWSCEPLSSQNLTPVPGKQGIRPTTRQASR
jgi:hypothetical protein